MQIDLTKHAPTALDIANAKKQRKLGLSGVFVAFLLLMVLFVFGHHLPFVSFLCACLTVAWLPFALWAHVALNDNALNNLAEDQYEFIEQYCGRSRAARRYVQEVVQQNRPFLVCEFEQLQKEFRTARAQHQKTEFYRKFQ